MCMKTEASAQLLCFLRNLLIWIYLVFRVFTILKICIQCAFFRVNMVCNICKYELLVLCLRKHHYTPKYLNCFSAIGHLYISALVYKSVPGLEISDNRHLPCITKFIGIHGENLIFSRNIKIFTCPAA